MQLSNLTSLTPEELGTIEQALPHMTVAEKIALLDDLEARERRLKMQAARVDPIQFALSVYPGFKVGAHHRKLSQLFMDVISGKRSRVIINIAPRMGKSEFSSYLFPAFFLGNFPLKKIIMGTHTASLSEDFGRRVRNLISSEEYAELFPKTKIADDQKAAGKWSTTEGGQYYAAGVGGALAGRGADLFVIDDPHSEQDVKSNSQLAFDTAWAWFQTGPLQRLMPGGAIIVIMTRWGKKDLTGRLLEWQMNNPESIPWDVIELPAILNDGSTENEKSLWPEQWPLDVLKAKKAGMDPQYWNAQYMQNPVSDAAAIIPRTMWKVWDKDAAPETSFVIQSWDTAYEEKTSADFSACTTWGVFYMDDPTTGNQIPNIILLDAFKARMGFPELKATAIKHYKLWKPDAFIIERKAAGAPLIQELRATGIPVSEFTPSRAAAGKSNDKVARLNACADMFASGRVWIPDRRWAWEVVEEVASFPNGDHDDYVDTTSQAMMRYRQGRFISLPSDDELNDNAYIPTRRAYY